MKFTKIKYKNKMIRFEYEEFINDSDSEERIFKSGDEPLESFELALSRLLPHAEKLLELPEGYLTGSNPLSGQPFATVSGVSFSWGGLGDETMGAVVTILKDLEGTNSPLVLNTPHLPEEPYGDNDCPVLPGMMREALLILMREAMAYMDGERKPQPTQLRLVS